MKKLLLTILLTIAGITYSQSLVINEVMASNDTTILDQDNDSPDWIEIYNNGTSQYDLTGYYLSDDSTNLSKWRFGNVLIEPGEFLVVFASDKDTNMNYWHTNFKISADGELVIMSDAEGNIVDSITVPPSLTDVSYGRETDADLQWMFQEPSPGFSNTGIAVPDYADSVVVSITGGMFDSPITLELSAGSSEIYYTLDGTDPDENSILYSGPISISETTILRAVSMKDNYLPSPIINQSYIYYADTDLPVVSLITDPANLFDNSTGIYINYGEDWEKPAHIQFFDENKNLGFADNVVINIYGGYTRRFKQKSLAVKFKSDKGSNKLEYELFPGFHIKEFKSFILRNSGNDFDQTHIRDAFMQTLVKDLDIEYLEYRPAVTFINGEYWGIYNIREKISEHYIAGRHGVDPDNIDMMEGYSAYNDDVNDQDGEYGLWVGNLESIHGDTINYKQLIDYLYTEDLTTDAAYDFIDSRIDLDECLLYYAAQVYYNSQDWPANNSKYWRERTPDGKWRWILYDLDFGFNLYEWSNEGNSEDHVDYLFSGDPSQRPQSKPVEATFIPRKIVLNPKIRERFVNQVADLLNSNFKTYRVINIMNEIADHIAGDIGKHRSRWEIFGNNLDRLISFAENRPDYLRDHIRNFFDSGGDASITVKSDGGGSVELNTLTLTQDDLSWSGIYFQDNPIHLRAIPERGYKFDGWSGTIDSYEQSIDVSGTRTVILTAEFSIDSSSAGDIVINEINYNSADDFDSGDWVELYNRSDKTIDVGDWYFSDEVDIHKFVIPAGTTLAPDNYLVLVQNDSAFTDRFPQATNYIGEMDFGLSGAGEYVMLVNNSGEIVDSLTYDDHLPWPDQADGQGASLELSDPVMDNSVAESWQASLTHGTPGTVNSVYTDVAESVESFTPNEFDLSQNYPNPFNPVTRINYSIPRNSSVSLKVYDILGREVLTLFTGSLQKGNYSVEFDASELTSGVYFYRIQSGEFLCTRKMLLMK